MITLHKIDGEWCPIGRADDEEVTEVNLPDELYYGICKSGEYGETGLTPYEVASLVEDNKRLRKRLSKLLDEMQAIIEG